MNLCILGTSLCNVRILRGVDFCFYLREESSIPTLYVENQNPYSRGRSFYFYFFLIYISQQITEQ